jgi:hypothetical protein
MAIVAPWFGGALGGSTRTVPRVTPRPTQGIDPITGVPIPLDGPVPITSESQLEKDARNGMTLDKPGAIPVEQVGYGGGNNDRKKDCKCPASHLCHGKPSIQSRNDNGIQYQLYIANLYSAPLVFSNLGIAESGKSYKVTEWAYSSVNDFDGMWPNKCVVVEAKDRYEHMFKYLWFNSTEQLEKWARQMNKQLKAVQPSWKTTNAKQKKVELEWHFSELNTKRIVVSDNTINNLMKSGLKVKHTEFLNKEKLDKLDNQRKKEFDENVKRGYGT